MDTRAQPRANPSTGLAGLAHEDREQVLAFTDFIYATGSSDHTGLSEENIINRRTILMYLVFRQ